MPENAMSKASANRSDISTRPPVTREYVTSDGPVYEVGVPVIAAMGLSGAGKSFFIKKATGNADIMIGHGRSSVTEELSIFYTEIEGRKIALLDTVGFENTHQSHIEVLKKIARGLAFMYKHGVELAGIVYLHNITSPRFHFLDAKARQIFEKLIGEDQLSNVTFVTTEGPESFQALRKTHNLWEAMSDEGSTSESFKGTLEGAQDVLRKIIAREHRTVLNIQREMVDQELTLSETAVGKLIREELQRSQAEDKEKLDGLRRLMKKTGVVENERFLQLLEPLEIGLNQQIASYKARLAELESE